MRERHPIDHSGHNIREGDIVRINKRVPTMWGRPDRLYLVRRLVKNSAFPQPCAVITPIDKPSYDQTFYVGYLIKVDVTTIPADKWDEFMEWLDAPPDPEVVEALRKLFASPTIQEREEVMLEPDQTGKLQAYVGRTLDHTTIVIIGHDLTVREHSDASGDFAAGLRKGLEGAGIEVIP
jgi:hypothetical protein